MQSLLPPVNYQRDLSINTLNAANPANPYDSAGIRHNKVLAGIQPCVAGYNSPTDPDIAGCIVKVDTPASNKHGTPTFSLAREVANDRPNNFANIIANCAYSPTAKQFMNNFVSLVNNTAAHSNGDYLTIKSAIETFEAPLIDNSPLAANERQTLLEMTSVARFSIFYWLHQTQGYGLSLKKFVTIVATAMTDAVSLAVSRDIDFSADSSEEAWLDMTYCIPG